jgi:hypothetical protein
LPYISPTERERTNWGTLPEAIAYVMHADSCPREDARHEISGALANGALWPLRWEDKRPLPSGSTGGLTVPHDFLPRVWRKVEIDKIDWDVRTALNRSEFSDPPRHWMLLIHRLKL